MVDINIVKTHENNSRSLSLQWVHANKNVEVNDL